MQNDEPLVGKTFEASVNLAGSIWAKRLASLNTPREDIALVLFGRWSERLYKSSSSTTKQNEKSNSGSKNYPTDLPSIRAVIDGEVIGKINNRHLQQIAELISKGLNYNVEIKGIRPGQIDLTIRFHDTINPDNKPRREAQLTHRKSTPADQIIENPINPPAEHEQEQLTPRETLENKSEISIPLTEISTNKSSVSSAKGEKITWFVIAALAFSIPAYLYMSQPKVIATPKPYLPKPIPNPPNAEPSPSSKDEYPNESKEITASPLAGDRVRPDIPFEGPEINYIDKPLSSDQVGTPQNGQSEESDQSTSSNGSNKADKHNDGLIEDTITDQSKTIGTAPIEDRPVTAPPNKINNESSLQIKLEKKSVSLLGKLTLELSTDWHRWDPLPTLSFADVNYYIHQGINFDDEFTRSLRAEFNEESRTIVIKSSKKLPLGKHTIILVIEFKGSKRYEHINFTAEPRK